MENTLTGKVHYIGQTQNRTETFKTREFVVEYAENPQYPEFIKFEATQDKTSLFDGFNVGDDVKVSYNLRGRRWDNPNTGQTQYFNTLNAWRVERVGQNQQGGDNYNQYHGGMQPPQQGGYNQGNYNQGGNQGNYNQNGSQGNYNQNGNQGNYNQNGSQGNYNPGNNPGQPQGNNFNSTAEDDDLPF